MKIRKKVLMKMNSCYAVNVINRNGEKLCLAAPDDHGAAKAVNIESYREEIVWKEPSGTMGFVPLNDGEFLSIQNFFPVFDSKHSVLVKGKYVEGVGWVIRPFLHIPYMHRADILHKNGKNYLIICTLCSGKKSVDDWSDPGKVFVGILPEDAKDTEENIYEEIELECVLEGQVKNHGYFKVKDRDGEAALVSSENGMFEIRPPETTSGEWKITKLLANPTGDVAVCDIDQDGCMEYLVVTPFHGTALSIYKRVGNEMEIVWQKDAGIRFGHVAWAGEIMGKPAFIGGCREGDASLLLIRYDENAEGKYKVTIIDEGQGPANICVLHENGKDTIFTANGSVGEVTAYEILTEE